MLQVSFKKTITDRKVANVRLATGSVQEHKMQLVLPDCAFIPLHNVHSLRLRALGNSLQFSEGIKCWSK